MFLPFTVRNFVTFHDAWIVGSAALPLLDNKRLRDIDVMIPYHCWAAAAGLIPNNAVKNTLGGWKYTEDDVTVDVWPDTLDHLASSSMFYAAWHPHSNIRIVRLETSE